MLVIQNVEFTSCMGPCLFISRLDISSVWCLVVLCSAKRQSKILHTDCICYTPYCRQPVRSKDHARERVQTQKVLPFWTSCIMSLLLQSKEDVTQSDLSVHWSLQWTWNSLSTAKIMLPLHERYCMKNYKGLKTSPLDPPLWGMKTAETLFHLAWKAEI